LEAPRTRRVRFAHRADPPREEGGGAFSLIGQGIFYQPRPTSPLVGEVDPSRRRGAGGGSQSIPFRVLPGIWPMLFSPGPTVGSSNAAGDGRRLSSPPPCSAHVSSSDTESPPPDSPPASTPPRSRTHSHATPTTRSTVPSTHPSLPTSRSTRSPCSRSITPAVPAPVPTATGASPTRPRTSGPVRPSPPAVPRITPTPVAPPVTHRMRTTPARTSAMPPVDSPSCSTRTARSGSRPGRSTPDANAVDRLRRPHTPRLATERGGCRAR